MNKQYNLRLLLPTVMVMILAACGQKDILPEPVGEPVPYTPVATRTWKAIMNDATFSHFKAAWNRSHMDEWVKKTNSAYHTLFIPSDKAFADGGWTIDKINTAPVEQLDSLLAYYVVTGQYTRAALDVPVARSIPLNTVLSRADLPGYSIYAPYQYRLYVGSWNDSLMINGKVIGKWEDHQEALNGSVYVIGRLVKKPTMTLLEYVQGDPRFTRLLEFINTSAAYYIDDAYSNNPNFLDFLQGAQYSSGQGGRHTLFLPTNEAFEKSGFHTEQDVRDRIERSLPIPYPDYDENFFYQYPSTGFDSMLRPHGFSLVRNRNDGVFFSKDLLKYPREMSGFLLESGRMYQNGNVVLETAFANTNGRLMVRDSQAARAYQAVIEADIECLNGVIHVVNDFLMKP